MLTRRLREVAGLVALGHTDKEIAFQTGLTGGTVKNYLARIYDLEKLRMSWGSPRVRLCLLVLRERYE